MKVIKALLKVIRALMKGIVGMISKVFVPFKCT